MAAINPSVLETLDMHLEAIGRDGKSTSIARGDAEQIAYRFDNDPDYSYITGDTEDDELDELAAYLVRMEPKAAAHGRAVLAEALKQLRDAMQISDAPADAHAGPTRQGVNHGR